MLFKINSGNQQIQPPACDPLVRFSHRLGESIRKPLWTHGVASKVLRPRFNSAQKTTPGVQMKKPICTTASARAFLIGDEKCGLGPAHYDKRGAILMARGRIVKAKNGRSSAQCRINLVLT